MQRVGVLDFLLNDKSVPVIDVRSPGEFAEGHIPGAINLPLFDDKERAIVGTTYTQIGRPEALDLGLEIVGPKMNILAKTARTYATHGKLKVHCWRGGMRSDKMAWLFELIGLETTVLEGGYKEYRQELLHGFESIKGLIVLHGPTGSGKTMILQTLKNGPITKVRHLAHSAWVTNLQLRNSKMIFSLIYCLLTEQKESG